MSAGAELMYPLLCSRADTNKDLKYEQPFQQHGRNGGRISHSDPDFLHGVLVPGTDELLRASSDVWPADVALRAR